MSKVLTNNDLYKKYGDDIVFLFKGDEPYVRQNGFAAGVLIEKNNKVMCNECEEWFKSIGSHLKKRHSMTSAKYKEKYGFNRKAPLCSASHSRNLREKQLRVMSDPDSRKKAFEALAQGHITQSKNGRKYSKKRMQGLNIRNACPEQMKQRFKLAQAVLGKKIPLNQLRQYDSGLENYGVRHFGSWNKFKKSLGVEIDTSSYKIEKAKLIYALRDYVKRYKSLPWNMTTKNAENDFPYSMAPYITRWGSYTRAAFACGIATDGFRGRGKHKKWYVVA